MATPKSVWGIDIGQVALKAIKLRDLDGQLQVEAFDIIEHPKILSEPDVDRKQLIRVALEQFLARNSVVGSKVVVAVPGQTSFTRFVKLPPVEEKRIPDIVKFEAEQQIPFPIAEVIWRYQTFHDPDSPDVELGIFAMKRVDVADMLGNFAEVALSVDVVQMAPLALYNFMTFDEQTATDGATLLVDVGAEKTDLVVADGARLWTRTVQIGGNNFTEALVRAFKLSFSKAEKLKRTAASSKYAKQIFQAMRPVFADLVQHIQRSIGYYTSLHRETRFKKLLGMGNGFRLPGLQKFLEQNLNIPVARIDTYNKVTPSEAVNVPAFSENVLSFAVAYGLALQGLGQTSVNTNLLPDEVATKRSWEAKRWWFAASAASVLLAMAIAGYGASAQADAMSPKGLQDSQAKIGNLERTKQALARVQAETPKAQDTIKNSYAVLAHRQAWPAIQQVLSDSLEAGFTSQRFLTVIAEQSRDRQTQLERLKGIDRRSFAVAFIESVDPVYQKDVDGPAASKHREGFVITIKGRTPLSDAAADSAIRKVINTLPAKCIEIAKLTRTAADGKSVTEPLLEVLTPVEYKSGAALGAPAAAVGPAGSAGTTVTKDPLFPDAYTSQDTPFQITVKVAVVSDGVFLPEQK